jgi:hypothetical protein
MHASDQDRIAPTRKQHSAPAVVLIVAAVLAAGWFYYVEKEALPVLPPAVSTLFGKAPPVAAPPVPISAPVNPPSQLEEQIVGSEPPLSPVADAQPLPSLAESDTQLKADIANIVASPARDLLARYGWNLPLIPRFVVFVNALAEGKFSAKLSPLSAPKAAFSVSATAPRLMTAVAQARYNVYIQSLVAIDPQAAAELYRRYYPLLQGAYAELGEKKTFHSVMLRAVDKLLATPELTQPLLLQPVDKAGLYRFADLSIESLPAAQKPLLRMGVENARSLKSWLRHFRAALLAPPR